LLNVPSLILLRLSPIVADVKLVQDEKISTPVKVTLLGIFADVKLLQQLKADLPIIVPSLGILYVRELFLLIATDGV
jgi:hypothetical protein